jgi:hypothetical protein
MDVDDCDAAAPVVAASALAEESTWGGPLEVKGDGPLPSPPLAHAPIAADTTDTTTTARTAERA